MGRRTREHLAAELEGIAASTAARSVARREAVVGLAYRYGCTVSTASAWLRNYLDVGLGGLPLKPARKARGAVDRAEAGAVVRVAFARGVSSWAARVLAGEPVATMADAMGLAERRAAELVERFRTGGRLGVARALYLSAEEMGALVAEDTLAPDLA